MHGENKKYAKPAPFTAEQFWSDMMALFDDSLGITTTRESMRANAIGPKNGGISTLASR